MKATSYNEKYEGGKELGTIFNNRLQDLKSEIKIQLPCRVKSVDLSQNQVNVEILDYDSDNYGNLIPYPVIPNVPIRQPMFSGNAYIILPTKVGDVGTIEFFDTSVKDLISTGDFDYDYSEDWHSLDNGLFTNGFLPKNNILDISDDSNKSIIIGLHNNTFKLTVDNTGGLKLISNSNIDIIAPNVNMTGNLVVNGNISATGTITGTTDVIANGKSGAKHTHTDSQGKQTSSPN